VDRITVSAILETLVIRYDSALFSHFVGAMEAYASERKLFAIVCGDTEPWVLETHRPVSRVLGELVGVCRRLRLASHVQKRQ